LCNIICLSETHLKVDETIRVPGYTWYGHNRAFMHRRAPKGSGGVGILLEDNIFNEYHIKVVDKTVDGIIGLEIKHKLSDFSLLVYSCYLPPENSPHGRDAVGFYSHLLTELYTHEEADGFVVCGDLNSRIGNLNDSITGVDNIPCRKVIDEVVILHARHHEGYLLLITLLSHMTCCPHVNNLWLCLV